MSSRRTKENYGGVWRNPEHIMKKCFSSWPCFERRERYGNKKETGI